MDKPRTLREEILAGEPLTEREVEVLQLTADGLTDKQVGENLHLSHETIKSYRKRIVAKLEALNSCNAVAIGIRTGLIK